MVFFNSSSQRIFKREEAWAPVTCYSCSYILCVVTYTFLMHFQCWKIPCFSKHSISFLNRNYQNILTHIIPKPFFLQAVFSEYGGNKHGIWTSEIQCTLPWLLFYRKVPTTLDILFTFHIVNKELNSSQKFAGRIYIDLSFTGILGHSRISVQILQPLWYVCA
jgi:hypothetical protein